MVKFRVIHLLLASLVLFACDGSKSHKKDETGQISFVLPASGLLLLAEASTLRIRIYAYNTGTRGAQEGNDQTFPLGGADAHYTITGVKLGWKYFEINALNSDGDIIGEGGMPYIVKPGMQTLDAFKITTHPPAARRRDWALKFTVAFDPADGGGAAKTSYLDVKQIFASNCYTCHAATSQPGPAGGLVLDSFPFKSTSFPTQTEVVTDMLHWLRSTTYPMPLPPNPRVPDEQIAVVAKWLSDGLLAQPEGSDQTAALAADILIKWTSPTGETGEAHAPRAADGSPTFEGKLPQAIVGGKYDLAISVLASDGRVSYQTSFNGQLVDATAAFSQGLRVPYSEPNVVIPIVVVPGDTQAH